MQEVMMRLVALMILIFFMIVITTAFSLTLHEDTSLAEPESHHKIDINSLKHRLDKWYQKNLKPIVKRITEDFFKPIKEMPNIFSNNSKERWNGSEAFAEVSRKIAEIFREKDRKKRKMKTIKIAIVLAFPLTGLIMTIIEYSKKAIENGVYSAAEDFKEEWKKQLIPPIVIFSASTIILNIVSSFSFLKKKNQDRQNFCVSTSPPRFQGQYLSRKQLCS